ncbi:MAG: NAD(P)H-binding protein [Oscillochloris sp.]|nr:NAD(P)H-binding protein [Oscillochloris sp.]
MRIGLFGATSPLGELVLAEALDRGHTLTALVTDPAHLALRHPRLSLAAGTLGDHAALVGALAGHAALVCCSEPAVIAADLVAILGAMRAVGLRRIVVLADAGILQEDDQTLRYTLADYPLDQRAAALEYWRAFALLRESGLRWTLLCLPPLDPGEGTGGYRAERDYLPEAGERIALADAAIFVLDELESDMFVGARVGIAE